MITEKQHQGGYNMTDWKELYSIELQKNMRLTTENVTLKKKINGKD